MNIAAQLISQTELKFFFGESSWEKTTLPFNLEKIKVELAVFFIDGICAFHNASTKPEPHTTHPSLNFCRERLTVANFKIELKVTGESEPYEVLLSNDWFTLRKEFTNAYTIIFRDIYNNRLFADWLVKTLPIAEIQLLLKGLQEDGRYYAETLSEFKEYHDLEEFTRHLFEVWWAKKVQGFEEKLKKGIVKCEDGNNSNDERYKPITFY